MSVAAVSVAAVSDPNPNPTPNPNPRPIPNQSDGGDRVLDISSDGDVQFDEELYKHLQARSLVITPSSTSTCGHAPYLSPFTSPGYHP